MVEQMKDQLGATYPELEWAMNAVKGGVSPNDFTERQKIVFKTYLSHHSQNQHKMNPIPVCRIPVEFL